MTQFSDPIEKQRNYTRSDFTALRAYLNRIPSHTILDLYYSYDDQDRLGLESPRALASFLDTMRDDLVTRLSNTNPGMAKILAEARNRGVWSKLAVDYLVQAADEAQTRPKPSDSITQWFRPVTARSFLSEKIQSLSDLVSTIKTRGKGWWRPIPRLGERKANAIVNWLVKHQSSLGAIQPSVFEPEQEDRSIVMLDEQTTLLVPIERMAIASSLSGEHGINRNANYPLISARHDLDALKSYLYKFRGNDKTFRAYQKELERFLLWCIRERKKALSSVMAEDCEAYKDFLDALPEHWTGPRKPRTSPEWHPFIGVLSAESQRYSIIVIRTFFAWLMNVRYLSGNPWAAVSDPVAETSSIPIRIEKAFPAALWQKLAAPGGIADQIADLSDIDIKTRYAMKGFASRQNVGAQARLFRATLLLIGNTGIRREEAAYATRSHLKPFSLKEGMWELAVLGKRSKWRDVFLTQREIDAIQSHWHDRKEDFSYGMSSSPLLSPVIIPSTRHAKAKHGEGKTNQGFSPDGIYSMLTAWLKRIAVDMELDLTESERQILSSSGVHALRHTFGTQSVAKEVPLDVVQSVLGHKSISTTSIYVRSEKLRSAEEIGKYLGS